MARTGAYESWSDADLLAGIADRDGSACTVFYRRHLPGTLAFLMHETHDPETAADLAGEVFAAVIVGARRYRPQTVTAAPWVIGIARNVLGTSRRRRRVQERVRRRLAFEPIDLDEDDVAETEALAHRGPGKVVQMVDELPAGERYAVKARVVDERSYQEIATELRCSELVVRKRVSRGLARVRRHLESS